MLLNINFIIVYFTCNCFLVHICILYKGYNPLSGVMNACVPHPCTCRGVCVLMARARKMSAIRHNYAVSGVDGAVKTCTRSRDVYGFRERRPIIAAGSTDTYG